MNEMAKSKGFTFSEKMHPKKKLLFHVEQQGVSLHAYWAVICYPFNKVIMRTKFILLHFYKECPCMHVGRLGDY